MPAWIRCYHIVRKAFAFALANEQERASPPRLGGTDGGSRLSIK